MSVLLSVLLTLRTWAHSRTALQLEILALRRQLRVQRTTNAVAALGDRPGPLGHALRSGRDGERRWCSSSWDRHCPASAGASGCGVAWKSRRRIGRPPYRDVRTLIRTMAQANPHWGARIHGELLKLRIDICQATVAKYMVPASASLADLARVFAESHRPDRGGRFLCGADGDVSPLVRPGAPRARPPTDPARRSHGASDGGVDGPTACGPFHGTDASLSDPQSARVRRSAGDGRRWGLRKCSRHRTRLGKWFVERFVGSARRGCLDHVIVFNEAGLQRLMTLYCSYHERSRTHLSLDKDTPIPRPVTPPDDGAVVAIPEVGGLHHRYERRAA